MKTEVYELLIKIIEHEHYNELFNLIKDSILEKLKSKNLTQEELNLIFIQLKTIDTIKEQMLKIYQKIKEI